MVRHMTLAQPATVASVLRRPLLFVMRTPGNVSTAAMAHKAFAAPNARRMSTVPNATLANLGSGV